jgi:hypothetical protein
MLVGLTAHARQRFSQRLNVSVRPDFTLDSRNFKCVSNNLHNRTGNHIQTWVWPNRDERMVLEIDVESKLVITVMVEGHVVDKIYATATL